MGSARVLHEAAQHRLGLAGQGANQGVPAVTRIVQRSYLEGRGADDAVGVWQDAYVVGGPAGRELGPTRSTRSNHADARAAGRAGGAQTRGGVQKCKLVFYEKNGHQRLAEGQGGHLRGQRG